MDVPLEEALSIAHQSGHYAYDAYMLECARRCNTAFLTLDRALEGTTRQMEIELLEVKG